MKFMATKPWYYNNVYYPASASSPHIFDFPEGGTPSITWWPLEQKSLNKLEELKARKYRDARVHPIPSVTFSSDVEVIPEMPVRSTESELPLGLKIKAESNVKMADFTRPSDTDPV